jgi:hypothetical protein
VRTPTVIKKFTHKSRNYFITWNKPQGDGDESIQLNEEVKVRGKPLKYFIKSDGILNKTEPLVFATRNEDEEVEISMHYEGLPIEPLRRFLEIIGSKWTNSNKG